MGRTSTKENKTSYQLAREELGLTREKASELLETIAPERIEKIENERTVPRPDEVLTMAEKYKRPSLCNYYCSRQCPIGEQYVPQVPMRELSAIVLEMLASLNAMNKEMLRLALPSMLAKLPLTGISPMMRSTISSTSAKSWSVSPSPWRRCSSGPSGCLPTARSTRRSIRRRWRSNQLQGSAPRRPAFPSLRSKKRPLFF